MTIHIIPIHITGFAVVDGTHATDRRYEVHMDNGIVHDVTMTQYQELKEFFHSCANPMSFPRMLKPVLLLQP